MSEPEPTPAPPTPVEPGVITLEHFNEALKFIYKYGADPDRYLEERHP
jgi:hypothetical protein